MYLMGLSPCICGKGHWEVYIKGPTQSSGYSFGKGILGAAILGPVGAVAGIGGKKTHVTTYKCSNCGALQSITYDKNGNIVR